MQQSMNILSILTRSSGLKTLVILSSEKIMEPLSYVNLK